MTIKELESLTGITRANIRFYESRGLISPARSENGYRDYTEDDLNELLRIKLLRSLQLPLEDIRALKEGEKELGDTLDRHLMCLEQESLHLENAQEICMRLRRDGAKYSTLNADSYLNALELGQTEEDALPRVKAPVRRYFARALDMTIYSAIILLGMWLFTSVDLNDLSVGWEMVTTTAAILLTLLIEPLLLSQFGTTPGKAALGLCVTDLEGGHLSYKAAFERTVHVLFYGVGLYIPLLNTGLLIYNCWRCNKDRDLEWEGESQLTLKDDKARRMFYYILIFALVLCFNALLRASQDAPRNTGDLTIAEFAENFNYVAERNNYYMHLRLDEDGTWVDRNGKVIHVFGTDYTAPDFRYTTDEAGHITSITLEAYLEDIGTWPPSLEGEQAMAIMAFVLAQNSRISFSDTTYEVLNTLSHSTWQSWGAQCNGVNITSRTELSGYHTENGYLYPTEGEEQNARYFFEMKLMN